MHPLASAADAPTSTAVPVARMRRNFIRLLPRLSASKPLIRANVPSLPRRHETVARAAAFRSQFRMEARRGGERKTLFDGGGISRAPHRGDGADPLAASTLWARPGLGRWLGGCGRPRPPPRVLPVLDLCHRGARRRSYCAAAARNVERWR